MLVGRLACAPQKALPRYDPLSCYDPRPSSRTLCVRRELCRVSRVMFRASVLAKIAVIEALTVAVVNFFLSSRIISSFLRELPKRKPPNRKVSP